MEGLREQWRSTQTVSAVVLLGDFHDVTVNAGDQDAVAVHGEDGALGSCTQRFGVATVRAIHGRCVVEMPHGLSLALRRFTGTARIGDMEGRLEIHVAGAAAVTAGRIGDAVVRLCGDGGTIVIKTVTGSLLHVDVTGWGEVRAGGDVDQFFARVTGSGRVYFGGCARDADLIVDGDGQIHALTVVRRLRRYCAGPGNTGVVFPPVVQKPDAGGSPAAEALVNRDAVAPPR